MKTKSGLLSRIQMFIENEAWSCSMDFGCVTPQYIYRIWGGKVALEDYRRGAVKY